LDNYTSSADVSARLRAVNPGASYGSMASVGLQQALTVGNALDAQIDGMAGEGAADSVFSMGVIPASGGAGVGTVPVGEADKTWKAWISGYTSRGSRDADLDGSFGASDSNDTGSMLGVERTSGGLRYGLVAAMGQATANFSDPNAHLESDHRAFGGFGSVAIGPVTVDVSALFGTAEDKVTRTDGINTARAAFNTSDTQLGWGVSVNLLPKGSGWQLTPVARVKFTDYSQDGFQETGTGVLVKTGKLTSSSTITKLGARLSRSVELGRDVSLGLDASAFWVHDFDAKGKELNVQLVGYNGSYTSTGRGSDSDAAQFNLGVQAVFNERWTLRLSGEQEMGVNRTQSTGMFSIAVNF